MCLLIPMIQNYRTYSKKNQLLTKSWFFKWKLEQKFQNHSKLCKKCDFRVSHLQIWSNVKTLSYNKMSYWKTSKLHSYYKNQNNIGVKPMIHNTCPWYRKQLEELEVPLDKEVRYYRSKDKNFFIGKTKNINQ